MAEIDFVTVGWHVNSWSAWILRNKLEEAGIDAFVHDEFAPTANWLYAHAIGFVKVQVPRGQEGVALEVIARDDSRVLSSLPRAKAEPGAPACRACGSTELYQERFDAKRFFLVMLILGIPIPFRSSATECYACGRRDGPPSSFASKNRLWYLFVVAVLVASTFGFLTLSGNTWFHFAATPDIEPPTTFAR